MLLFLPLSMSCGPGDAEVAAEACETQSAGWDGWGRGFFTKWCGACHSATTADRRGAPVGSNFDSWDEVWAQRARIEERVLVDESMPLGGGLSEADRAELKALLACDDDAASDPGDESVIPPASLDAAGVAARADRVVAGGIPFASAWFDGFVDILMAHADPTCPEGANAPPYAIRAAIEGCVTADGWMFSGLTLRETTAEGTGVREVVVGDGWGRDPEGRSLVFGGELEWWGDGTGADALWESRIDGTWGYEGAPGWQGEMPSLSFAAAGAAAEATLDGGIAFVGAVVYFDALRLDAAVCPGSIAGGGLRVRDDAGYWTTLTFDEDCSACGAATFADGSSIGTVCVDPAPLWASLVGYDP